jgi:hypothetical protein
LENLVDLDSLVLIKSLVQFTALVRVDLARGNRTIVSSNDFLRKSPVEKVAALTYWETENVFLLADRATALFRLTPEGKATLVGFMDHDSRGLAFSNDPMPVLYSISGDDDVHLKIIDPTNAKTVSEEEVTVTLEGEKVSGANGLATHPGTGELWTRLDRGDPTGLELATIVAPSTGDARRVGNTDSVFVGLAFDAKGNLYTMSNAQSQFDIKDWHLYTLSTTDATPNCVVKLTNTGTGKAIAFNPTNGLLYHAAYNGNDPSLFESINLVPPSTSCPPATTEPIPLTFRGSGRGTGPPFVQPKRIVVDANHDLIVVDQGLQAVIKVDHDTGERTILSR